MESTPALTFFLVVARYSSVAFLNSHIYTYSYPCVLSSAVALLLGSITFYQTDGLAFTHAAPREARRKDPEHGEAAEEEDSAEEVRRGAPRGRRATERALGMADG